MNKVKKTYIYKFSFSLFLRLSVHLTAVKSLTTVNTQSNLFMGRNPIVSVNCFKGKQMICKLV